MPIVKLDAAFCAAAQCAVGKRKTDYYDSAITGLVMEVRSSGGRSFYLRYQDTHGRQKQYRIAGYQDATLDKIRKEAQRLRSEVVLGGDPAQVKAEKKAIPTYAELAQQHLAYAKTYQRSYDTTEMYIRRHILPKWQKKYLSDITQQDVAAWLADKAKEGLAPATVEKIRILFHRSLELALRWNTPGLLRNPVKGIPRKPINNSRDRYLTSAEAERLLTACEGSVNPQLRFIIPMLLYTGARLSELLHAQWKDIDFEKRVWLIPLTKNGSSRRAALSTAAMELLTEMPRHQGCPYIFANPKTGLPYVSIKKAWQTARDEAKLPGLRLHDLRHACATFLSNSGIDLLTIGRQLGHRDYKSTLRYSKTSLDTLLAAVEAGADKMHGSPRA